MEITRKRMRPLPNPVPQRAKIDGEGDPIDGTTDGNVFFWTDADGQSKSTRSWTAVEPT